MNLPRPHLSFSQITLWLDSPESYRKRYYPSETPEAFTNMYMEFGNEVTEAMEKGEEWVAFIPRFETFELKLNVEIEGVPILGFIDNIDLDNVQFNEQKTGMTSWSENKVNKHLQLDLYSLLLQEAFERVTDECNLVWVGTEKHFKTTMMGDIKLTSTTLAMRLTGEFKVTPRIITQKERDDMRSLIVKVAREIEEDYTAMKHLY